jgi:predicted nicotinamide N-methyase
MVRLLGYLYYYYVDVFFLLVFVWYIDTAKTTIAIAARAAVLGPIVAFHHPRSHRSSSSSSSNTFVPNCQWHRYRQRCPTISYSPIHHDEGDTTHHCPDDDAARVSVVMVPTLFGLLECVPIPIPIVVPSADHFLSNNITTHTTTTTTMVVTIVEASAPTQNHLVDLALSDDDDDDVVLLPSVPAAVVATTTIPDDDNDSLTTHDALTMGTTTTTSSTKVQDPYGSVLWPAASAVATYLMTTVVPTMLVFGGTDSDARRRRHVHVLELGCGTGLVSMTVGLAYQEATIRRQQEQRERELSATTNHTAVPNMAALSILATDYELLPLQLVQYAAQHYNHIPMTLPPQQQQKEELSTTTCDERPIVLQTMLLDICNLSQPLPLQPPSEERYNLVVAADLLYDTTTAVALAHRIVEAIRYYNATVIVGDSPGRVGRPVFLQELIRCGIQNPTFTTTSMGQKIDTRQQPRHELMCGVNSTSVVQPWNHLEGSPTPTGTPPVSPELWLLPIDILHLDGSSLVVWR